MLTQIFMYEGAQVRTVMIDDQPHCIAKDVCDILEIGNSRDALSRLDDDEKGVATTDTLGGSQQMTTVNEAGLYNLIFTSRKAEAKAFKRWVTHEVLPQIRKTGSYNKPQLPSTYIEALEALLDTSKENLVLQQQAQLNAPKVALYDVAMCANNNQSISKVAKSLGYGPNKLFKLLKEKKILMLNNTPYQRYIDAGYFDLRIVPITRTDSIMNVTQPLVTAKGVAWLHNLIQSLQQAN